ncbi:MAG: hypothetical protein LBD79_09060 [Treponema sp.]|jgi:hypothetical protein|nr:hypothetical protein [Treponema sp.]
MDSHQPSGELFVTPLDSFTAAEETSAEKSAEPEEALPKVAESKSVE